MLLNSFNEKLRMTDLPKPTCNPKEVLIRVLTTSLNFADILMTKGKYQEKYQLPFSPGMEVCGIITLLGNFGLISSSNINKKQITCLLGYVQVRQGLTKTSIKI